jgi:hypothetical protein
MNSGSLDLQNWIHVINICNGHKKIKWVYVSNPHILHTRRDNINAYPANMENMVSS